MLQGLFLCSGNSHYFLIMTPCWYRGKWKKKVCKGEKGSNRKKKDENRKKMQNINT